ncbi:MAG: hypothetical protein N0A15_16580, partial [Anaerolineae bacterium]|nr:hypothetical protein [Anaerolineae bacterium]
MFVERPTPRCLRWSGAVLLVLLVLATAVRAPATAHLPQQEPGDGTTIYLPLVTKGYCAPESLPRINAPRFSGSIPFEQTAIAWFGRVSPTQNYADIRVGTNNAELYVYVAAFDRALWYDENPTPQTLTQWDA